MNSPLNSSLSSGSSSENILSRLSHHKKILVLVIGAVVILVLSMVAFYLSHQKVKNEAEKIAREAELVRNLSSSLESSSASEINVPSTNPAKAAVPSVDPSEKTNPFNDEYENPFE